MRASKAIAALIVVACSARKAPPATTPPGAVAADDAKAAEIGDGVLARGGNAIDAAVATALALGVVNPSSSGIGGGGFAVVYVAAEKRTYVYDFRETAPAAISPQLFDDPEKARTGGLAVAVPGELAGLYRLQREHGALGWADDVTPAVGLARDGFAVSAFLARAAAEVKIPPGAPYDAARALVTAAAGARMTRPALAAVLARVAAEGPDAFYRGPVADHLIALVQAAGGVMTAADLAGYQVRTPSALEGHWHGLTLETMPLPSSGGVILLEALGILDALDARGVHLAGAGSALTLHLISEALEDGFADRARLLGDTPEAAALFGRLLDPAEEAKLAARIDPAHALAHDQYGHPELAAIAPPDDHGTSHLCVIDAAGNAVALTTTVNGRFGAKLVTEDGIVLDDEIDDFAIAGGAVNQFGLRQAAPDLVAPGKRPLSTMTPLIVLDGDRVVGCAGGSGGPRIASSVALALIDTFVFDASAADAIAAPRIHDQWSPEVLEVEPGGPADELRALGHQVEVKASPAAVQLIRVRPDGTFDAAADRRKRDPPAR